MLNEATTRAMTAKARRIALNIPRKSPSMSAIISSVSWAPVIASSPCGNVAATSLRSSSWLMPSAPATRIDEASPGRPDERGDRFVGERGVRGRAEAVGATERGKPDDRPRRPAPASARRSGRRRAARRSRRTRGRSPLRTAARRRRHAALDRRRAPTGSPVSRRASSSPWSGGRRHRSDHRRPTRFVRTLR